MKTGIAAHSDIEALITLLGFLFDQEAEFTPNPALQRRGLEKIIDNPQLGEILVTRKEGVVIGMVSLLYTISTALGSRVAVLEDMVVHPGIRHRGIGKQLIKDAVHRAEIAGCQRITLLTDSNNKSAQKFYEHNGFIASSMIPFRLALPLRENEYDRESEKHLES